MPQASAAFQQLSEDMVSSQNFPLVTDVASVKLPIGLSAIGILPPQSTFVGSHPMAGKEMPGFAASEPELFADAAWPVMVESRATLRAVMDVCALALDCGARPIPMTAGDHDRVVASISHLPHVLATTLLSLVTSTSDASLKMRLAAGSFRDGTRVATQNAELVGSMCELNKTHVLDSIDATIAELTSFRDFVATASSAATIAERVDRGAAQRLKIVNGDWLTQQVVFALDDNQSWRSVLLELGSVGGHIGGLRESHNQLRLTLCVPRVS
jgi:prephenate dehydrogenase